MIPSFYDSIELNRDRAGLKFQARALLWNPFLSFVVTFVFEMLATLLLLRFMFRCVRWVIGHDSPGEHPVERAARLHGLVIPEGWVARPKPWQRHRGDGRTVTPSRNPYAARASVDVEARLTASKTAEPPIGAG